MQITVWSAAAAAGLVSLASCTPAFILNQIKERTGNIGCLFINTTPYRASFSFGTYDALDLEPPGPTELEQLRIEGGQSAAPVVLSCRRNMAVGTQAYIDRVLDVKADQIATFDPNAFAVVVNFSSAPADSDAAGLPTQGTAQGIERLLGVDYSCGDELVFTFVEDPDAPGGFRIDFEVIVDQRQIQ